MNTQKKVLPFSQPPSWNVSVPKNSDVEFLHPSLNELVCFCFDYKSSSSDLLDCLANFFSSEIFLLQTIRSKNPKTQTCFLLSTCNRFEIYLAVGNSTNSQVMSSVLLTLQEGCPTISQEVLLSLVTFYRGKEVATHLFEVASGLKSMVLGETEILGQIAKSYQQFLACAPRHVLLQKVIQTSITVGKKVHFETESERKPMSIASVAVELLLTQCDIRNARIALLGAGKVGKAVYHALVRKQAGTISWYNRTLSNIPQKVQREQDSALEWQPSLVPWNDLDVVIACTSSLQPLLEEKHLLHTSQTLYLMDLSIPRNIHEKVFQRSGVCGMGLPEIRNYVDKNVEIRKAQIPRVQRIVQKEVDKIEDWFFGRKAIPFVCKIVETSRFYRRKHIEETLTKNDHLSRKEKKAVQVVLHNHLRGLSRFFIQDLRQTARCGTMDEIENHASWMISILAKGPQ